MRPPHRVDSSWTGIGPDRCRVPCVSARVNFLPKLVPVMNQKSPAPRSRGSLRNGINNGKVLIIICHTASHRCHCSRWCCGREKKHQSWKGRRKCLLISRTGCHVTELDIPKWVSGQGGKGTNFLSRQCYDLIVAVAEMSWPLRG